MFFISNVILGKTYSTQLHPIEKKTFVERKALPSYRVLSKLRLLLKEMSFCSHTFQNLGLLLWSKFFPLRLASSFERTQIRKRNFPCCKSYLPNEKGGNYVHIRVIFLGNVSILLKSFAISFPRHFKVQMLGLSFLIAQGQF